MTAHIIDYEINKELGECYLFMSEFDKAQHYYAKAIEADPKQAAPFMGLAAIALHAGGFDDAYNLYKRANDLEITDKSLTGMAMIEVEQGRHEEALSHYVQALGMTPGNMLAVNGLVQLSYFMNCLEVAIPHLEAALDVYENDETIRFTLAGCLLSIGREAESKAHLEALLGENPGNAEAQELYAHVAA